MKKSHQRMVVIGCAAVVLASAVGLAAVGLRSAVAFFRTPSEILAEARSDGRVVRVGGLVTLGSVRSEEGVAVFQLQDDLASIEVSYAGILPSLFREGQCVVAEGALGDDGSFSATRVIAAHDENYRAPEITESPRLARSCGAISTASTS